jgi:hypothetical protein
MTRAVAGTVAPVADVILLITMLALPTLAGAVAAYLAKPWWWGAAVAIAAFLVAAVAPEPEEGESRVAVGDIAFLVVVAVIVGALAWLGAWAVRRYRGTA